MVPESGRSRATTRRPSVDLPQPDSPTSPRVSPASTVIDTPETACKRPVRKLSTDPMRTENVLWTLSIAMSERVATALMLKPADVLAGSERPPSQLGESMQSGDQPPVPEEA